MRHVITLTTIPPRFGMLGPVLTSLLRQKQRPEQICLYLPRQYRRFAGYAGALPDVPDGVTIVQVDEDLGPATKVLFAARALRGQAVDILYCDDDHHYRPDWSARLLRARKDHPDDAVAACGLAIARLGRPDYGPKPQPQAVKAPPIRQQLGFQLKRLWCALPYGSRSRLPMNPTFKTVERSGYIDIAEGFAGVAIAPDFLDDQAFAIPSRLWSVDDVWLSGHLARRGVKIWAQAGANRFRTVRDASSTDALYASRIEGAGRRDANRACVDYMRATYGVWGGKVV